MKKIALSQIDSFGRSEIRGRYCIYLKPTFSEEKNCSSGVIHEITRIQADALHTFLKTMSDSGVIVKFPEWKTLTLGDIQITAAGDIIPVLSMDEHVTVDNYRTWAREIMSRSDGNNFPHVVRLPNAGFLSTEGEWSLIPRANDFVLAYLRPELSDAEPPTNIKSLSTKLRNIFKSELVKNGALYFEGDGIHCDLGPITNTELLYIAESLLPSK